MASPLILWTRLGRHGIFFFRNPSKSFPGMHCLCTRLTYTKDMWNQWWGPIAYKKWTLLCLKQIVDHNALSIKKHWNNKEIPFWMKIPRSKRQCQAGCMWSSIIVPCDRGQGCKVSTSVRQTPEALYGSLWPGLGMQSEHQRPAELYSFDFCSKKEIRVRVHIWE